MPDAAPAADTTPTMVVRPSPKPDGQGGDAKPAKLSRNQVTDLVKEEMPGLSAAGVEGVVRNVFRESSGDPGAYNPDYSGGLFQHHNTRFDGLKTFAKTQGTDWRDPRTQVRFSASELKKDYPTLLAQLSRADDPAEAEDSFKRVFERPASIMWANNPKTASDNYRYSDYAMGEHKGRKNTDIVYMSPSDYLDLSPDFEHPPFSSPSGKSLQNSMARGDEIEAIPTLDMRVKGNTGTVTDQDGRHRALMAQQEGIDAIPVAIRKTGKGEPTEIQGLSGAVVPNDFQKAPPEGPKEDRPSLFKRAVNAIVPSAEAAEPKGNPWDNDPVVGEAPPAGKEAAGGQPQPAKQPWDNDPVVEPDGMLMSGVKGAAAGLGRTVLGGQELLGKGLEAAGAKAPGEWLVNDARKGIAGLDQSTAADRAAHPWATGAGEVAGGFAIPGGIAGKIGTNALRAAAIGGGIGGLLEPDAADGGDYWRDKAKQVGIGTGAGAVAGKVGNALSSVVAPRLAGAVRTLMNEGVELTPGQMKGGIAKAMEDKLMSVPITGDAIKSARRRGMEQFNRAAMNRALGQIGQRLPQGVNAGHDAIEAAQTAISQEYDRVLTGTRLWADPAYHADIANLRTLVGEMPPDRVAQFDNIYRNRVLQRLGPQNNMDGETFKQVESELTTLGNGFRRSRDMADQQLGAAINEVKASLRDALERSNPGKRDEIAATNRAYAMLSRAEDAASRRADSGGVFSPGDLWQAIKKDAMRSGRRKAFARGDAMMQDLADAGQEVLPSKIPDSGTWGRALATGGLAEMLHHPEGILPLLAGAIPYTAPVSRAANAAMNRLAQQPGPTRNALAEMLRLGGQAAGPAAGQAANDRMPTMTIHPGNGQ